jgi:hypothetical protein
MKILSSKYSHLGETPADKEGTGRGQCRPNFLAAGKRFGRPESEFYLGTLQWTGGLGTRAATRMCIHMTSAWYLWGKIPTT